MDRSKWKSYLEATLKVGEKDIYNHCLRKQTHAQETKNKMVGIS